MNWKIIRIIDALVGIPLVYAFLGIRRMRKRAAPAVRSAYRKILLMKFWGIGNLLMMLPSLESLMRSYPDAEIDLLTLETNRSAAACVPAFHAVYTVDTRRYIPFLSTSLAMVRQLRRRDYDLVIDFEQFARFSALCTALIGKKATIGFQTAGQQKHVLFSHAVVYDNTIHVTRSYGALAAAAGAKQDPDDARRYTHLLTEYRGQDAWTRIGLDPKDEYVVFHVGTSDNFKERRWPARHWAALAERIVQHHALKVVLAGLAVEGQIAADVLAAAQLRNGMIDACGKLTFPDYFALIRESRLVISADTMTVHLASAIGAPVVGLYGPNTPVLYGPWGKKGTSFYRGLECSPCITNFNAKTHTCTHPEGKGACMRQIDPLEVYQRIEELYFRTPAHDRDQMPAGEQSCIR